ncbi:hypothetical protein B0O99DRAFT_144880 [Bisporella sp. PMI_857]|nr:hypothetical protein B0O99DRAFT_144880 [Bisporella sp. PMI_857]
MAIRDIPAGILARIQALVDRVVKPETRSQFYASIQTFATDQPILATFLLLQVLLSGLPLLLFASFAIGTLLVSFVSAILFSLFWIGLALLVLLPTLFVTVSAGLAVGLWAVGSVLIAKWAYNLLPQTRGRIEAGYGGQRKTVVTKTEDSVLDGGLRAEVRERNGI